MNHLPARSASNGRTVHLPLALCATVALLTLTLYAAHAQETHDIIQVSLHPWAAAAGCVRLGDLAEVSGGTVEQRRQLAQLDIADMPRQQPGATVTRDQVAFRLQLAGLTPSSFRMVGA